ncbi:MAG TPA: M48 family metalloprotease, partial [Vicinamibacterales bacterium]
IAGAVGGAMVGGAAGAAITQGAGFGLGTILLKYSRDYEKQADLLGAQMMARAGYDPRDLGRMFETIEKESKSAGGGGPQWMSSHPNPGNRTVYINQEAGMLKVAAAADVSQFAPIKAVFASLPAAMTMAEMAKRKTEPAGNGVESVGTPGQPVPRPSTQYRSVSGGKVFEADIPSEWKAVTTSNSIRFIPQNGFGPLNGQTVFTHGVEFGLAQAGTRDLRQATMTWLKAVSQSNPELKMAGDQQNVRISQRAAIGTPLVNPSPLGGPERLGLYTTFLADGTLFYFLTIVPEKDSAAFNDAFKRIGQSIRLTDVR